MFKFSSPLSLLPLIELIGFFVIGGKIGFFASLLWLILATMLGFWLLMHGGLIALQRGAQDEDGLFKAQDAFDSLCILIAALLLIVPGFISDFIAIPFILAPFRHWLFGRSRDKDSFMRRFTQQSRGFREWTYTKTGEGKPAPGSNTTIEGDFRRVDDTDKLSEK